MTGAAPVQGAAAPDDALRPTASLRRRLTAFVYEGVLLFGIIMIGAYVYDTLTQHRHALEGRTGLQAFLFLLLGVYFTWFWTHGGQTVAMKTWHLRLVDSLGRPLTQLRAFCRYLLSWLWFLPALATAHVMGPRSALAMFALMFIGVVAYAALARAHPQRQFLHDVICGTRLIDVRVTPAITHS